MTYLSETTPIYTYHEGGRVHTYQHNEVKWDDLNEEYYVINGPVGVWSELDRPAKWWCVAVYDTSQAYGGPEEGGWYYQCGSLAEHAKIRFFDNYTEASMYEDVLWDWCDQPQHGGTLKVRSYTEQMPETWFPQNRPYYC